MSQAALDKYESGLSDNGLLLVDNTLVHRIPERFSCVNQIPATELAEAMGLKVAANVCMFGALAALTGWISPESCRSAIEVQFPGKVLARNIEAFDKGFNYFKQN